MAARCFHRRRHEPEDDGYDSDEAIADEWRRLPPSILVLSKPGSVADADVVAKRLSRALRAKHVSPKEILEGIADGTNDPFGANEDFVRVLKEGREVTEAEVARLVDLSVHADDVLGSGYVAGAYPATLAQLDDAFTWQLPPAAVVVVDCPDEDCVAGLRQRRWDPANGQTVDSERLPWADKAPEPEAPVEQDGGEPDSPPPAMSRVGSSGAKKPGAPPFAFMSMMYETDEDAKAATLPPPNPKQLVLPEGTSDELASEAVQQAVRRCGELLGVLEKRLGKRHILHVSALQPLCSIVRHVMHWLADPVIVDAPLPLPAPPEGMVENETLRFLLEAETTESQGQRAVSSAWGLFCPVSFYVDHDLVRGKESCAASYTGRLFLFESEEKRQMFRVNPRKYLCGPTPGLPRHQVYCIIGAPLSGKTTQATALARALGVPVLDMRQCVESHIARKTSLAPRILEYLQVGEDIPAELYCEILEFETRCFRRVGAPRTYGASMGWVLDGFPVAAQHVAAMQEYDMLPDTAIVLGGTQGLDGDPTRQSNDKGPDSVLLNEHTRSWVVGVAGLKEQLSASGVTIVDIPSTTGSASDTHGFILQAICPIIQTATEVEDDLSHAPPLLTVPGLTGPWCPVSLAEHGCLVPGTGTPIRYRGRLYKLAGEAEVDRFVASPASYVGAVPPKPPAPRIFIAGATGSGKTTACLRLCQETGLKYVNFEKELATLPDPDEAPPEGAPAEQAEEQAKAFEEALGKVLAKHLVDDPEVRAKGCVVDGFPRNARDLNGALEKYAHPDVLLFFDTSLDTVMKRLRREFTIHDAEARAAEIQAKAMDEYREELKEREAEREAAAAQSSENSEQPVGEDGQPIEQRAPSPPPPPPPPPDVNNVAKQMETEDREAITRRFEGQDDALQGAEAASEQVRLPSAHVDAQANPDRVQYRLRKALELYIEKRGSLFVRSCVEVDMREARELLNAGAKRLSHFGMLCPVHVLQERAELAYLTHGRDPEAPAAVVFNHCVYFPCSQDCLKAFTSDPDKHARAALAFTGDSLPRCSVVGPPMSGKSSVSLAVARSLGAVRVTAGKALRAVVEADCVLGRAVLRALREGLSVPADLTVRALLQHVSSFPMSSSSTRRPTSRAPARRR
eukprot:m51a1_g12539 putative adenylate kinase domain-containing protein 1-like (1136) ;mRNA; r:438-4168